MDVVLLLVMPQEGIVGIGVIEIQSRTGAESGVLELTRRRLWDYSAVVGRLELGEGHLGVVPVEVVAAPGIPVWGIFTLD